MNYRFEENINIKELDNFSFNSPKGHIFQSSHWMFFKKEWMNKTILGFDEKDNIVLSSIILIRNLPILKYKIGYIPRGFVCDYTNKILLAEFTSFLRKFSIKNKIAFITIDPDIHLNENQIPVEKNIDICTTLKSLKFVKNNSKNFENIQPNFVFRLNLPSPSPELTKDEIKLNILKHFSSKARYNIKLGIERGLEVESYKFEDLPQNKLDIFQNLMETTGKRDNFVVRKKEYFYNMLKILNPYCNLYLVKYNYTIDKDNIYRKIEQCKFDIDKLNIKLKNTTNELKIESIKKEISNKYSQIESFENKLIKISEFKNKEIYLSGAIYLKWGKKAWYLYGASSNILRDTMPNFLMQYKMIQDSIDNSCNIYDFRGVSGNLNENNPLYGLYKFKKMFNGDFIEFIGEYSLVNNKLIYYLFNKLFPKFKSIRNIITQIKKK